MSGREMVLAEDLVARCFHEEPDAGPDPAYTPITEKALTILAAELDIRVMLTDVDMPPDLNGYELARRVHERWPGVEILVSSGRQWPTVGDLPEGAAFLAKPVPNEVLVSYVQAAAERSVGRTRPRTVTDRLIGRNTGHSLKPAAASHSCTSITGRMWRPCGMATS